MTEDRPLILDYAQPPRRVRRLTKLPLLCTLLIAAILPGFASMLLDARFGGRKFVILSGGVVAAFIFFGPVWGELLFRGTAYSQAGLIPFLVTWALSIVISLFVASNDWSEVRR